MGAAYSGLCVSLLLVVFSGVEFNMLSLVISGSRFISWIGGISDWSCFWFALVLCVRFVLFCS